MQKISGNAVFELANAFANMPAEKMDAYWETALMRMVNSIGFDRSTLWKIDHKGVISSFCWARNNISRPLGIYFNERLPYVFSQISGKEMIHVVDVGALPPCATIDHTYIHLNGLRYMICVPVTSNDNTIAWLTIGSFDAEKRINACLLDSIKWFSVIFAHALHKQKLETMLYGQPESPGRQLSGCGSEARRFMVKSKTFNSVLNKALQVAPTDTTVLIQGETGTGKELVARFIHNSSRRSARPMYAVNCATFSPELMESQLFGHERGAFTGALSRRIGLFETASDSTLFFDEIAEMPPGAQAKMLRVLQEKQFERLGSSRTLQTNSRIIAATNKNMLEEMRAGNFREDLFYRINVFPIHIPPLRERRGEIPTLVRTFIDEFNVFMGKHVSVVDPVAMAALTRHEWPGNIRELRNVVERAMILSDGDVLAIDSSTFEAGHARHVKRAPAISDIVSLAEAEKQHIIAALNRTQWRVSGKGGAAELLRINPKTLDSRMRKLGITRK